MSRLRVVASTIVLASAFAGRGAAQEVGSATVVLNQVNGDAKSRFSMVILGDGYTAAELPRYRAHLDKHLNILWSYEPWRSYRNYINVYSVEVVSGESGIDCDPEIRERRRTPLGLSFGGGCTNITARGITPAREMQETIRRYAAMATGDYDQILIIANTDTYGGIGGALATTSGGNALGPYITPHELGHSLGRLSDEYMHSARGVPTPPYQGGEPDAVHLTLLTVEQMKDQQAKWWRWLGETSVSGGVIDRYEGGGTRTSGIWRPSKHSMMQWIVYPYDQPSRERMVQRISARVNLIAASTPTDAPVGAGDVIWIDVAHPNYHDLSVTWTVDGQPLTSANGSLNLQTASLAAGAHQVTVKVVDDTDWVRDPMIRDTTLTATKSWAVSATPGAVAAPVTAAFTNSTLTSRPVSGTEVVYVETTHPSDRVLDVSWTLDGKAIPNPANSRSLHLAKQNLTPGTHILRATVTDPKGAVGGPGGSDTREWTVDNTLPTVAYELSTPVATVTKANGARHLFMRDEFTMRLLPTDDQAGYVVSEFRVDGDGWYQYYGWPDAKDPNEPFHFTPRGTVIKELVYGSMASEGLAAEPFEPREPGWGTRTIEYRALDAAGNIGLAKEFHVTFMPAPACTQTISAAHSGDVTVSSGVTCVNGGTITGAITVGAGASIHVANGTVTGSITATDAAVVELVNATVGGAVRITGTTDAVTLFGSALNNEVAMSDNRTKKPATIVGNTITGALVCTGNNADPLNYGTVNTARGSATGQCSAK
jgi:hypothetical protein